MTPSGSPAVLPPLPSGFQWLIEGGLVAVRPETSAAEAVFTTRVGGGCPPPCDSLTMSYRQRGIDLPADEWQALVSDNRKRCSALIDANPHWTRSRLVHGADVVEATWEPGAPEKPDADGLWTTDSSRTLAVTAADCVPVLLALPGRVAAVHAGWRGALAGVIEAAVRQAPGSEVFIGPSIGPCCLELGEEITSAFVRAYGPEVQSRAGHVDLWRAAELAAMRAGARVVATARLCTFCLPSLFFSHRRDRGLTGRQALVARVA